METKPTAAFVVSLLAGMFILLNGLIFALAGAIISILLPGLGILVALFGLGFGLFVLVAAVVMYAKPDTHVACGVIVLLFSLGSILIGGGFLIGMILGIVGGALGISWKQEGVAATNAVPMYMPVLPYYAVPWVPSQAAGQEPPFLTAGCRICGERLRVGMRFCSGCGTRI